MPARSIILLLATVLIPALALTMVGVVLVRQQDELIERRAEAQARLTAREAADSLFSVLQDHAESLPIESHLRYPRENAILNLGRLREGRFDPPFPPIASSLGDAAFQNLLRDAIASGQSDDYRRLARRVSQPDQRAFLSLREAMALGEPTEAALEIAGSGAEFTDEFGIPLALYAMEATGQVDATFAPMEWLRFEAISYARDLEIDAYAKDEHTVLRHVRDRFSAIEDWRLSPDSAWMLSRQGEQFVGVRVDSLASLAASIPGVVSVRTDPTAASIALAPSFPFLHAEIEASASATSPVLWVVALGLVLLVTVFASLVLFRDARRERRLAELRARFVSSVSHEVRTPLAGIRLFTDSLLAYGPGTQTEWRADLETISYETDRLTRMLDNVLRASRIERGTDRYDLSPGDLRTPVQRAVKAMAR